MPLVSYDTVTDRVVGRSAAGSLKAGTCNSVPYPAWPSNYVPLSSVYSYEQFEEHKSRYDPTKGRSFSQAKRNGAILMSELFAVKETIQRSHLSVQCVRHDAAFWAASCNNSGTLVCATRKIPVTSSWTENFDYSRLSAANMGVPTVGSHYQGLDDDINDAIVTTQQQAWEDAVSAYDLLSELGEARETLKFLGSAMQSAANLFQVERDKDPKAWNRCRTWSAKRMLASADPAIRKIGSRWMAFRYAIMPIVYSIQDVIGLLNGAKYRYQTDRAMKKIVLDTPEQFSEEPLYLSFETYGSVIVRSTTKAAYNLGSLQKLVSRVGFNPFVTAWELTTLSFVLDWFINVGAVISALTSLDYSSFRNGCTSVRQSFTDRTYATIQRTGVITRNWTYPCGTDSFHSSYNDNAKSIIVDRHLESYRRTVWTTPPAKLVVDPFLDWKRFIDAFVLGYKPTFKLLRSL